MCSFTRDAHRYFSCFYVTSREGLSNNTILRVSKMFHPIFAGAIEHEKFYAEQAALSDGWKN